MPVTTMGEVVETMEKAEQILNRRGWTKHAFVGTGGKVCFLQAIREANGPGEARATNIIMSLLGRSITTFNDAEETRFEDVITVLHAARHIAKELSE